MIRNILSLASTKLSFFSPWVASMPIEESSLDEDILSCRSFLNVPWLSLLFCSSKASVISSLLSSISMSSLPLLSGIYSSTLGTKKTEVDTSSPLDDTTLLLVNNLELNCWESILWTRILECLLWFSTFQMANKLEFEDFLHPAFQEDETLHCYFVPSTTK